MITMGVCCGGNNIIDFRRVYNCVGKIIHFGGVLVRGIEKNTKNKKEGSDLE